MAARAALADLISRRALEDLADERSFERGLAYFRNGAVERLVRHKDRITARVVGTDVYTIRLWPDGDDLGWDCTCPVGQDGEFCKHLVATGLAWLAGGAKGKKQNSSDIDAIRRFLEGSDKSALVELLTEHACEDEDFSDRLLLAAQRQGASDPAALKEMIRRAFAPKEFVDYREMPKVAARAAPVAELLRESLKRDSGAAMALASDAMKRGLGLLGRSDDSDGRLGDILSEIAAIHQEAAGRGGFAPRDLAEDLFKLQLADGYDFLVLEQYLPALGKDGLAAYRKLALDAWKKVPQLAPGPGTNRHHGHRDQIAGIMKTLAEMDGDIDALVDVLGRDLADSHAYLEIAQVLQRARRHDEALKWAEDGRRAFARETGYGLDDFLVAEYHRRGRHDEAIALRWSHFSKNPALRGYQEVKASADRAASWSAWREKALAALRKQQTAPRSRGLQYGWHQADGAVLIEVFLWEGNPVSALEAARARGCPSHLWLQLAKALEPDRPDDAIAIYREQINPIVRLTGDQAYDQAADLLRRIRGLMARAGRSGEFAAYLQALRIEHKAKRNFIQRLETVAAEKGQPAASNLRPSSSAD